MNTIEPRKSSRITRLATRALLGISAAAAIAIPPAKKEEKKSWFECERCLDKWGGSRAALSERGIEFNIRYTAEVLGNVSGGMKNGAAFAGLLDFGFDLDFGKLAHIAGLSMHVNAYSAHGDRFSGTYGGDIGTSSNIEFANSVRLFEAWVQQELFDGKLGIRLGQLALDSEFMAVDSAGVFFNSDFGADAALSGNMPVPIYAIAAPGVRVKFQPTGKLYLQAAVYDGNPAPGHIGDPSPGAAASNEFNRHGVDWSLRSDEGALIVAEVGYQVNRPKKEDDGEEKAGGKNAKPAAPRGLQGSYKAGFVYHTDTFTSYRTGERRSGNYAIYGVVEQELWREPGTENQGLSLFGRAAFVPGDRNNFAHAFETGLVCKGLIPGRDDDVAGIGYAHIGISSALDQSVRAADPTLPKQDFESVIEGTYKAQMTPWLTVQPDVQHVFHPGGSRALSNEWVVGCRVGITF